jgi:signal transduction histidine kinase
MRQRIERLGSEALVFAVLRGLTLVGGVTALVVVPVAAEHRLHVAPLLAAFVVYKAALLAVLLGRPERSREIFLTTLVADLAIVFLLVWFTGGGASQFYLLFYPLVALNAYYFGPVIAVVAAGLAAGLLAAATWLSPVTTASAHVGARAALLGLLALALGHVAARERRARARAEELHRRLAHAEQLAAVGRLSAKMAHEVRNPLGAINLNVDMLRDLVKECPGPAMAEAEELIRDIRVEVRALTELTDEYLLAARLPRPRLEKESLNDVVADLIGFLRPLAERQGVRLTLDLGLALPPVACDAAMVKQAVGNLVKNGLEMLPHGGHVHVRTAAAPKGATIAVADDGPGVSAEAAAHLFEPFFTTKSRGTGLGLPVTLQITAQHGGDVRWSNRPEGGAEFVIRLPFRGVDNG